MTLNNSTQCPHCGSLQRPTAKFCNNCGQPLSPAALPLQQAKAKWATPRLLGGGAIAILLIITAAVWLWTGKGNNKVKTAIADPGGAPLPTAIAAPGDTGPGSGGSEPGPTPTAVSTLPPLSPTPAGQQTGSAVGDLPIPPTLEELLKKYPELERWSGNIELDEDNLEALYKDILMLYKNEGVSGLHQFLLETGLLEALNMDPRYLDFVLAYEDGGVDAARELAYRRGFLTEDDELFATLILDTNDISVVQPKLEDLGFTAGAHYENEIDVTIPIATLAEYKSSEEVLALLSQLAALENVIGVRVPNLMSIEDYLAVGQGPGVTGADKWHTAGYTGRGIKIGILDLGFAGYQNLAGTTVPLNAIINDPHGYEVAEDHGTACAEIIHAMAPEAELYLAWIDKGSSNGKNQAVEWLLSQGVDIVSASLGSLTGPMDGTGKQAELVRKVNEAGVLWVNASGNYADTHLLVDFSDNDGNSYHEFPSGSEMLELLPRVSQGEMVSIALNWNESWDGGAEQNYDLRLYEGKVDSAPEDRSDTPQSGGAGDYPYEIINYRILNPDTPLYLAIKNSGATLPVKFNLLVNGADFVTEASMPPYSLGTPADAAESLTVGASHWRNGELTFYSSQGPTLDDRGKPDMVAPTEVESSVYSPGFGGTSASAPHVAGAAALVYNAFPGSAPESVRGYLLSNALDLNAPGYDTETGHGRLFLPDPPAPGEELDPSVPAAVKISTVWAEHNIIYDNRKGIIVHADFRVNGGQGKTLAMIAHFFNAQSGQQLRDQNGVYKDEDGNVAAINEFQLSASPVQISDMAVFLPYDELDLPAGQNYQLAYAVTIHQTAPATADLAVSEQYPFNYYADTLPNAQIISSCRADYDAVRGGEQGMELDIDYTVNNFSGQDTLALAIFYFDDSSNRALRDFNGQYRTYTGKVAAWDGWLTAASNNHPFSHVRFFLPYSELHLTEPGDYKLKYYLIIFDREWNRLYESDWCSFNYTEY